MFRSLEQLGLASHEKAASESIMIGPLDPLSCVLTVYHRAPRTYIVATAWRRTSTQLLSLGPWMVRLLQRCVIRQRCVVLNKTGRATHRVQTSMQVNMKFCMLKVGRRPLLRDAGRYYVGVLDLAVTWGLCSHTVRSTA